ncbi:MAG: sigma-54-dependent Fis family transcriptional regulator [Planctomycetes bacterium]|nr:sigma-54-dependent Fis family transcriptional regulator [Planctomycetota bacterium]
MAEGKPRVLVVDDEASVRELLEILLAGEGYRVRTAGEGGEALEVLGREGADLVIQDLRMPGMDGLGFLGAIKDRWPEMPAVVITAHGTWDDAVEAMRLGAFDYLKKPFDTDNVRAVLARALTAPRPQGPSEEAILGNAPAIQALRRLLRRVAATDATVLVLGESGTGKELVARSLHRGSLRAAEPFIPVSCGGCTETLILSELFGHRRGAFTGAVADKRGLFELADRGTLFLDEVAELSLEAQAKLLRVLQERAFIPLGGEAERRVDVRIVAATNKDLAASMNLGAFREDLYYRLAVVPLAMPPLRERREDVPLLAGHFLARYARAYARRVEGFSPEARAELAAHDWPGNVRELENTIHRLVAMTEGPWIAATGLGPRPGAPDALGERLPPGGLDLEGTLAGVERGYLELALARTGGNLTEAAALLGLSFRAIRYKVKKLGVDTRRWKGEGPAPG